MMPQGVADFKYENDSSANNLTALAGMPLFIDLLEKMSFSSIIKKHLQYRTKANCWSDTEQIRTLLFLNIAGGDCVDDINVLNSDKGLCSLIKHLQLRKEGLSRRKRREIIKQGISSNKQVFPSQTSIREYLKIFHNESQELLREQSSMKSFIPEPNNALRSLGRINSEFLKFLQLNSPSAIATIDIDATLIPTNKRTAKYSYKKFKAYQGLNAWWDEQQMVLNTEFRDGNVNAAHQITRFLKETLHHLPEGIKEIAIRSDTAGYQYDLMDFCEIVDKRNNGDKRFGKIKFAIGVDVSKSFREAVAGIPDSEWITLEPQKDINNGSVVECAEVCYVTNRNSKNLKAANYRYLVTRQLLSEQMVFKLEDKFKEEQLKLPFPVAEINNRNYKIHGIVTNYDYKELSVRQVINWFYQRAGYSEKVHSVTSFGLHSRPV